jgi:hypothetical protein
VEHQTSWVGSIVVVFSIVVTIGVAAYLYRAFGEFKSRNDRLNPEYRLEEGETEFEIAPAGTILRKPEEQEALVTRTSDDEFFFDEEEEIGGR